MAEVRETVTSSTAATTVYKIKLDGASFSFKSILTLGKIH